MNKDYKAINKAYRKAEDPEIRKQLEALLDKLDENEELTEEQKKEAAEKLEKEKAEKPKEEQPKVEPTKEKVEETKKEEVDVDQLKEKLGLGKYEQVISSQAEELAKVKKELEKVKTSGVSNKQGSYDDGDDDYSFDKLFEKASVKPKYTK